MLPAAKSLTGHFLTFCVDAQLYALRSEDISEVIRVPTVVRIPQGPAALLGLANLRGSVLPVASLRELLKMPRAPLLASARAIVLDAGSPVALVVDSVEGLESVHDEHIETRKKELSAERGERLLGAFTMGRDRNVAKILDIKALLELAFARRARAASHLRPVVTTEASTAENSARNSEALVTFDVAGQEFALPLSVVQEILPAPKSVTAVAHAEELVLGVISARNALLPLLSLRGLLGFGAAQNSDTRQKVIVVNVAGTQIGLVADRARAIVDAETELVDPLPPVLAARTGGESRIRSIYRGAAGRRLISILSPEHLFREDVMQRLIAGHNDQIAPAPAAAGGSELVILVFRLGDDEFGLPIDAVIEVAQVPEQITRVPKAPKFIEGVVNLRGDVLPVVDQRRRFEMQTIEKTEGRRLVIMKTERHRAGLIVDSVSEVLRTRSENVEPPPDITDATARLVRGVVNLEESNRLVLLLDPTEVLTRAEQSLLDSLESSGKSGA